MDALAKLLALVRGEIINLTNKLSAGIEGLRKDIQNQQQPVINVQPPKVEVNIPEIRAPDIHIPEIKVPQVTVNPPDIHFPAELEINDIPALSKAIKNFKPLEGVTTDNPIPVLIIGADGKPFKQAEPKVILPLPTPIHLLNTSANAKINPATEDTLAAIKAQTDKLNFTAGALQTTGGGSGGGGASTIADGADTAEGATTDTAVTSDSNGTLSAKLRGLVKIFASVWDSANGRLKVDGSGVTQPVSGSVSVSNFPATQPISASSLPLPTGASTGAKQDTGNTSLASIDGKVPALGQALAAASVPVVLPAAQITTLTPLSSIGVNNFPATQPVSIAATVNTQGAKTNNNAAPGATNLGTLPGLANAAPPTWTEGNQVGHSFDLAGNLRAGLHPLNALGYYALGGTVAYTATTQNGIIFSFRWGDATRLAVILRVDVNVLCTAFTTAGIVERQLILVRSFSASDTGGTALTPSSSNNKLRTSQGTSLATDIRIGGFLSAGTGTADANPISQTATWMAAVGVLIPQTELWNAANGVQYPIVLAQNEGFRVRLGAAETASTRQTFVRVVWAEVAAY